MMFLLVIKPLPQLSPDKALNELVASIKKCDYFEQAQDDGDDEEEEEEEEGEEEEAAAEGENVENQEESVDDTAQPTQVSEQSRCN